MHAADVMTPDVICATPETPLPELVRLMLDNHVSALPIVEDGRIIGIISEGDLLHHAEIGTVARPSRWLELLTSTNRLAVDYARAHGWRGGENPARWKGGIQYALPAPGRLHRATHRPALSWQALPGLMAGLHGDTSAGARCERAGRSRGTAPCWRCAPGRRPGLAHGCSCNRERP